MRSAAVKRRNKRSVPATRRIRPCTGLLEGLILGAGGSPNKAGAGARVASKDRIKPFLKLADLFGVPALRCVQQPGWYITFGEVLQLHHLTTQPDIDRHHDLLARPEAVGLVRSL